MLSVPVTFWKCGTVLHSLSWVLQGGTDLQGDVPVLQLLREQRRSSAVRMALRVRMLLLVPVNVDVILDGPQHI